MRMRGSCRSPYLFVVISMGFGVFLLLGPGGYLAQQEITTSHFMTCAVDVASYPVPVLINTILEIGFSDWSNCDAGQMIHRESTETSSSVSAKH